MRTFAAFSLSFALLAGCAGGVRSLDSYEDPDYDGPMQRVLLLLPGLFPNAEDYARDRFLAAFEARGIELATREDHFRAGERLTREKLIATLDGTEVDGVLLVDLAGTEQVSRGRKQFADVRGNYGDFEDEIGYLLSTGGRGASSYREAQTDVFLRLRLFPGETRRLAWELYLDVSNPGSAYDLIDRAAPRIAAEVARSGLVARR